jgi:hypothetical protein
MYVYLYGQTQSGNAMDNANKQIITDLKKFFMGISFDRELWLSCVVSDKSFTRKRALPFNIIVLMILSLLKRSLMVEIHTFFAHIQHKSCSKAAFCMQRAKLKPLFFELWNRVLIKSFYHHYKGSVKQWKDFILLAFDGSTVSLPNTKELSQIYRRTSNEKGEHGLAATLCVMYDVLNKLIIKGNLFSYLTSERLAVMEQLKYAPANSLLLFDRGYPCFWLFYLLMQNEYKFVMRIRVDFSNTVKSFVASSKQDCTELFRPNYDTIKEMHKLGITVTKETAIYLRLVKIPLKTGETEVLITNLYSSKDFSANDLKEVYFLRWGVETFLGTAKNQLQIENFSGIRKVCIEQDIFANLFIYNLQSIIEKQTESALTQISKNRKHNYHVNKNISWAFLKERLIDLFLKEDSLQVLLELQALFQQHLEPVRPNRSFPRMRKVIHRNGKYRTLTNYKCAI